MSDEIVRPDGDWRLWLAPSAFVTLRDSGELHLALLLARMIDALRFGMSAAVESRDKATAHGDQQRHSFISYTASVLNEIEDWRKSHHHEIEAFPPFAEALAAMDAVTVEPTLRAAMGRLRNKIVSHFDSQPFESVIASFSADGFHFAEGKGNRLLAESNDLANAVVLVYALQIEPDLEGFYERTMALMDAVAARANAFGTTGRTALQRHLLSRGAKFIVPVAPPAV